MNSKSNLKSIDLKRKQDSNSLAEVHESIPVDKSTTIWKKILAFFGPAYLISVGYMDPGNWATDIAGGSQFGYQLIWVLLMSNIMALLLQSLSARLGVVKRRDLAQASKETYPKYVNYVLYFLAEIAIAAMDLAEVLGMAIGLQLLFDIPLIWGVCFTVLDTFLLLFLINKGMRKMEAFIIALIAIIGVSFFAEMLITKPDISEIATGLIPSLPNNAALYIAIGIIGATVMPHNLYLHSSLVQTRKFDRSVKGIKQALKYNFWDSLIALNFAFLVNAAILILAATVFYKNGMFEVAEIQDAHRLLEPLLGTSLAGILFALALIAAGQSSTITGTLAGQIVMEGHLNLRIQPWVRRVITRLLAIIPALLTILLLGEGATGKLLILSQVVLSLQLGFAIIPLIHFVSDKKKMGQFAIKSWMKIMSWLIASIIVLLNAKLVWDEINGWLDTLSNPIYIWIFVVPFAVSAALLLVYITVKPLLKTTLPVPNHVPHLNELMIDKEENFDIEDMRYKNIAIALDFSSADKNSVLRALKLGNKKSTFTLIHVVETAGAFIYGDDILDYETSSDDKYLSFYKESFEKRGYTINTVLEFGVPKKAIPKIINQGDFDILVMGTHGHSFLKNVMLGTTIDKVRHKIDIPILIVKAE